PARASNPQFDWCAGKGQASPDLIIGSCTAIIQSGKVKPSLLHVAFFDRAIGYLRKGDTENALKDFDQAIALHKQYPAAYTLRAIAHTKRKEYDAALGDFDTA